MAEPLALIGVEYDEYEPETYRAVRLYPPTSTPHSSLAFGGEPETAMAAAEAHAARMGWPVGYLSSVDNFRQDMKVAKQLGQVL